MSTYLDTSAWNDVYDQAAGMSIRPIREQGVLFSSCNLDEFVCSGSARARQLAQFAWRTTDRRKLYDHVELLTVETAAHLRGEPLLSPHDDDANFNVAWDLLRREGVRPEVQQQYQETMWEVKGQFREWLRGERRTFKPLVERFELLGFRKGWAEMLSELENEGFIREHLAGLLEYHGQGSLADELRNRPPLEYRELPGTACWVQYYMALAFSAAYRSGKNAKPDLGDQVDFRHAAYAGITGKYVTGDGRMADILRNMVPAAAAEILTVQQFLGLLYPSARIQ